MINQTWRDSRCYLFGCWSVVSVRYEPNWESLCTHPVPIWYHAFVHLGCSLFPPWSLSGFGGIGREWNPLPWWTSWKITTHRISPPQILQKNSERSFSMHRNGQIFFKLVEQSAGKTPHNWLIYFFLNGFTFLLSVLFQIYMHAYVSQESVTL